MSTILLWFLGAIVAFVIVVVMGIVMLGPLLLPILGPFLPSAFQWIFKKREKREVAQQLIFESEPVQSGEIAIPYRREVSIVTNIEMNFYQHLKKSLREEFLICPKVRMEDFISVGKVEGVSWQKRESWRNTVKSSHVDFLLCGSLDLKPILGIELDDSTHQSRKAIEKDNKKDSIYNQAGLPILRIQVGSFYDVKILRAKIKQAIRGG